MCTRKGPERMYWFIQLKRCIHKTLPQEDFEKCFILFYCLAEWNNSTLHNQVKDSILQHLACIILESGVWLSCQTWQKQVFYSMELLIMSICVLIWLILTLYRMRGLKFKLTWKVLIKKLFLYTTERESNEKKSILFLKMRITMQMKSSFFSCPWHTGYEFPCPASFLRAIGISRYSILLHSKSKILT